MEQIPKTQKASLRIEHITSHLNSSRFDKQALRENVIAIEQKNGYMNSRALFLQSYFTARGIWSWLTKEDGSVTKNLLYNRAKIHYISTKENWNDTWDGRTYTMNHLFDSFPALVSDNTLLVKWYSNFDYILVGKGVDDHHSYDYQIKNFFIAMRGEWDLLEERSKKYIKNPRPKPPNRWIMDTFEYYLGLATGDVKKMETALAEFVKPRFLRSRADVESGYTADIISTEAVVLAKLAWRNGYEVNIDSPYVPKEWLPVKPLDHYEDEFDFMKAYTIDPTWGGKFI